MKKCQAKHKTTTPQSSDSAAPPPYDRQTAAGFAAIRPGMDAISAVQAAEQQSERTLSKSERDAAIAQFLPLIADHPDRDLLADMMGTVVQLAFDPVERLDLKILAGAMKELRYAFKVFAPFAHRHKISIFGSARTPTDDPAYRICLEFARKISEKGWMVITGAGDGIMRAGHEGAGKDLSFGVSIRLPFETNANEFIDGDPKLVNFRYFFTRKLMFLKEAEAVALFPGGFGTHDELFETLTLVQTGKSQIMPIVVVDAPGGLYWEKWELYVKDEFLRNKLINKEDLSLFKVTDDADEAVEEVTRFYHRYASSRYVNNQLILRLSSPLPTGRLAELNRDFADICKAGVIEELSGPLPQENGEEPALPRLRVPFDRKSYGRLRRLIDAINKD